MICMARPIRRIRSGSGLFSPLLRGGWKKIGFQNVPSRTGSMSLWRVHPERLVVAFQFHDPLIKDIKSVG